MNLETRKKLLSAIRYGREDVVKRIISAEKVSRYTMNLNLFKSSDSLFSSLCQCPNDDLVDYILEKADISIWRNSEINICAKAKPGTKEHERILKILQHPETSCLTEDPFIESTIKSMRCPDILAALQISRKCSIIRQEQQSIERCKRDIQTLKELIEQAPHKISKARAELNALAQKLGKENLAEAKAKGLQAGVPIDDEPYPHKKLRMDI